VGAPRYCLCTLKGCKNLVQVRASANFFQRHFSADNFFLEAPDDVLPTRRLPWNAANTMAIEGLYEDQENTSSPMVRRRSSVRRPLGAINSNTIMSPLASATKAQKAPATAVAPQQSPLFIITPEVSPWTVPDSPMACPLDEKEFARKRSWGAMVLTALALGAMLTIVAGPTIMISHASISATAPAGVQSGPTFVVEQSPIGQAVEEQVVSYGDDGPTGAGDEFDVDQFLVEPAVPIEIAADDAAGFVDSWGPEESAHNAAEVEKSEPFAVEDDWAPLSIDDLAAGLEQVTLQPAEAEEETAAPWEASIMSGPLHIPQKSESDMPEFAGFARMSAAGDLYLFTEADAEFPTGMLALDGCISTSDAHGTCFALNTGVGAFEGCVGDAEEAMEWVNSARQVPCN